MKLGRESKGTTPLPPADLLVCFPSRSRLTLIPKAICSPNRQPVLRRRQHRRLKSVSAGRGLQASPLIWAKSKSMGSEISEPTSPKVSCAGQIKITPKTSSCKSWQTVMEEIERIRKRKSSWVESIGFKKDIMQFLTCLRRIRFDFRCFRAVPEADFTSDDDEEEGGGAEKSLGNRNQVDLDGNETSRRTFSKWFMVLQENRSNEHYCRERTEDDMSSNGIREQLHAPPSNALLLMRCRSAPAKSWQEEEEEEDDDEEEEKEVKVVKRSLKWLMEEENRERLIMEIDSDFYKTSSEIAKDTWVVDEKNINLLSRSRSWRH